MIKVDLVYSNYLNSPDGASRFVKSMSGLQDDFLKCGVDLRVITPDLFSEKHFDEGLPISIIEGMRSGLPIIGSRIAGIPEQIIEGKTGFLVDLDEHQLAETIKFCVDHIDILEEMGKASYEYFLKKFTIDAMVRKYAEIYKSAVQSE